LSDAFRNRLLSVPRGLRSRLRILRLRMMGMHIGPRCWLRAIDVPRNPWDVRLEGRVALDDYVVLLCTGPRLGHPRIHIHPGVYVNRFTMIDAVESVEIGPDCMIGPYCYITDHDHGTEAGVPLARQGLPTKPTRLGRNVWLGAGVTVLKGVTIGDEAVVGAGAVVTKDVPAGQIVAGVPARSIGRRE